MKLELEEEYIKKENSNIFVAVDVETTGLSAFANELIEVSAIKYDMNGKLGTFSTLIKPKLEIPYRITTITGITNEMVRKAPMVEDVMPRLIEFIGQYPIVAHNANFDFMFLQNYSDYSFSKNQVIDTVKISRKINPGLPNHKLGTVAKYMGVTEDGFHRAEFDCECCAKIYMKYLKLMSEGE